MIDTAGGSVCAASYGVARTCSLEPALIPQSREKGPRLFQRGRTAGSKNHLPQMTRGWRRLRFVESAIPHRPTGPFGRSQTPQNGVCASPIFIKFRGPKAHGDRPKEQVGATRVLTSEAIKYMKTKDRHRKTNCRARLTTTSRPLPAPFALDVGPLGDAPLRSSTEEDR